MPKKRKPARSTAQRDPAKASVASSAAATDARGTGATASAGPTPPPTGIRVRGPETIVGITAVTAIAAIAWLALRVFSPTVSTASEAAAMVSPAPIVAPSHSTAAKTTSAGDDVPAPGFLGVIVAGESVAIEPKTEGRVEQLLVVAGEQVTRGRAIARLDRAVREEDLRSARAVADEAGRRFARRAALARGRDPAVTAEEVDAARSQLAQERARLAAVSAALAETEVVAPFDGTIVEVYLAPGALAGPGRPIVRLVGQSQPQVRFAIPDEAVAPVLPGAPVDVAIGALGLVAAGKVTGVNPEVDTSSRMIHASARLDVADDVVRRLTTGLIARVRLSSGVASPGRDGVTLPPPAPVPAVSAQTAAHEPAESAAPDLAETSVPAAVPAPAAAQDPQPVRRARRSPGAMPRW
jgi:RND family efflux transporter MFP subunit